MHLHFGVLAAAERERVEEEMRTNRYGICVATTTLEIGIDIGDIDAIVLSDLPRTVSGFLQRIDVCRCRNCGFNPGGRAKAGAATETDFYKSG